MLFLGRMLLPGCAQSRQASKRRLSTRQQHTSSGYRHSKTLAGYWPLSQEPWFAAVVMSKKKRITRVKHLGDLDQYARIGIDGPMNSIKLTMTQEFVYNPSDSDDYQPAPYPEDLCHREFCGL